MGDPKKGGSGKEPETPKKEESGNAESGEKPENESADQPDVEPEKPSLFGKITGTLKKGRAVLENSKVVSIKRGRNRPSENAEPDQPGLLQRLFGPIFAISQLPLIIVNLLKSRDAASKVLALGILFAIALFAGSTLKIYHLIEDKLNNLSPAQQASIDEVRDKFRKQDMNIQSFVEKQYGTHEDRKRMKLGPLTLLTKSKNNPKLRSVEMTIHLLCDSPESCNFIKRNIGAAQDLLIMNLEPVKFEEVTSDEGRKVVKEKIKLALDKLGRSGVIDDVYFSTFLGN